MRHPFITSLGRKTSTRNLRVTVSLSSGVQGRGEASASLALKNETQKRMARWMGAQAQHLLNQPIWKFNPYLKRNLFLDQKKILHPTARGALECALLEAISTETHTPLYQIFGGSTRPITTDITLSNWGKEKTVAVAHQYYKAGFRRFKIKINQKTGPSDIQILCELKRHLRYISFWLDANQGFSVPGFMAFLKEVQAYHLPIKGVEQPTPKNNHRALGQIRKGEPLSHFCR